MEAVKGHLHKLIDTSENMELLNIIYEIIQQDNQAANIWASLTDEQKKHVLDSENSISDSSKLITHSEMIERNKKWLK